MSNNSSAAASTTSKGAMMALIAAFLGWLFDGFEMGLFPLIGKPALQDLLPGSEPSVQSQWFTVIIGVFLVGAATGGVLFGWLGDKLGRVKAMALAIFTYALFTGLCAFVTEAWQFASLRFIASLGMGGEWSLGVALVNEIWAGRNRAWIAGLIGAAANLGFLLTGLISLLLNQFLEGVAELLQSVGLSSSWSDYLLHNRAWRFLSVLGAAPAIINFFILFFVHESDSWKREKSEGKTSHWEAGDLFGVLIAAIAAIVIIYAWSPLFTFGAGVAGVITVVGIFIAYRGYIHPVRKYISRASAAHADGQASHAAVNKRLILGAALAGVALLGTWGSTQQAPKWSSDLLPPGSNVPIIEYTVLATAIGAILSTLITPLIADRLGRRLTYTILCLASLVTATGFFQLNSPFQSQDIPVSLLLTAGLLGAVTASFYGFFPLYFPELFPTSVRATAQGFCFNFGRLIAAVGALQLGNLVALFGSPANAYTALSSVYLIGMVIVWFCPETKELEE
jgi:MFS transporter, SHS family, sialic acid transporter